MAHSHSNAHASSPRPPHEADGDIHIGAIFKFVWYLTLLTVVVHGFIWFLMNRVDRHFVDAVRINFPMAAEQGERLPPEPRLQVLPREELHTLREREREQLEGYSWVDKGAGVVRVPIEQAMKQVLDRGLPTRGAQSSTAPPAAAQAASTPAQESSERK